MQAVTRAARAAATLCAMAAPAAPAPGALGLPALGALAGRALWPAAAAAEDFTFRRVGLPGSGSRDRITVQIDPSTRAVAALPNPPPEAPAPEAEASGGGGPVAGAGSAATAAGVEWFWDGISPLLADSGPGRLREALAVLEGAPDGAVMPPRLQALQDIARLHGRDILAATVGTRVSPALVLAVISVESAGQTAAESRAGAQGLMQLMPATARRFGVADSLDPVQNIRGGVAYLDWLLGRFGGDPVLALAGYNAGEGAVDDSGGVPPYRETRAYVPKVLLAWTVARGLCQTPPELASDGCVFAVNAL